MYFQSTREGEKNVDGGWRATQIGTFSPAVMDDSQIHSEKLWTYGNDKWWKYLYKGFGWRFHLLTFTSLGPRNPKFDALFPFIAAPWSLWPKWATGFAGAQGKQNVSIFRPRRPGGAVHHGHEWCIPIPFSRIRNWWITHVRLDCCLSMFIPNKVVTIWLPHATTTAPTHWVCTPMQIKTVSLEIQMQSNLAANLKSNLLPLLVEL